MRSPPSSFTPLPVRVRGHLGPELTHTWAALPQEDALPAADLGPATGLCSPGEQPTRSQLATLLGRLQRLAAAGLAACDELGRWVALPGESLSPDVAAAAEAAYAARAERISSERAQYELVRAGRHRWERERAAAVQRNRAAAYLGSRKWWEGLAADERNVRQAAYAARFANLSVAGQRAVKQELASRRARAGVASEEALRRAWIQSLPPAEYTDRVVQRTIEFAALPGPLQAAKAAAWAAHRAIWQISRDVGPPMVSREPDAQRDRMDQLEQLELLALSEILERDPNGRLSGLEPGSGRAVARSRAG